MEDPDWNDFKGTLDAVWKRHCETGIPREILLSEAFAKAFLREAGLIAAGFGNLAASGEKGDLLAEAYLKAVAIFCRPREKEIYSPIRFLRRSIANLFRSFSKKQTAYRKKMRPLEEMGAFEPSAESPEYGRLSEVTSELANAVRRCVLPKEERLFSLMMEKRRFPEIAEILKIPIGTVSSRAFFMRRRIRLELPPRY